MGQIRKAADLAQVVLASQIVGPQTAAGRLECQHDMLLSTLTGHLKAVGERPRIVVTVNGQDVELDLAALVRLAPASRFPFFPIARRRRPPPVGGRVAEGHPAGTRSALPPTKAAGMLRRFGGVNVVMGGALPGQPDSPRRSALGRTGRHAAERWNG